MKKRPTYEVNRAKGHLTFNQVVAGSIPAQPTIESSTYVSSGEVQFPIESQLSNRIDDSVENVRHSYAEILSYSYSIGKSDPVRATITI